MKYLLFRKLSCFYAIGQLIPLQGKLSKFWCLTATNLEKVNAITKRDGKSTRDPPYPTRTGKAPAAQEEKKNDEVEEMEPQE